VRLARVLRRGIASGEKWRGNGQGAQ